MADSGATFRAQQLRLQAAQMEGEANMRSGETFRQSLTGIGDQYLRTTQQGIENQFQQRQQDMQRQRLMMEDAANQAEINVSELRRQKLQQDIMIARQLQESGAANENIRSLRLQNDSVELEIQERKKRMGQVDPRMLSAESMITLLDYADSKGEIVDLQTGKLSPGTPDQGRAQKQMRESILKSYLQMHPDTSIAAALANMKKPDPSEPAGPAGVVTDAQVQETRDRIVKSGNPRLVAQFDQVIKSRPSVPPQEALVAADRIDRAFDEAVKQLKAENPGMDDWKIVEHVQRTMTEGYDQLLDYYLPGSKKDK